jgi:hypothetical protein
MWLWDVILFNGLVILLLTSFSLFIWSIVQLCDRVLLDLCYWLCFFSCLIVYWPWCTFTFGCISPLFLKISSTSCEVFIIIIIFAVFFLKCSYGLMYTVPWPLLFHPLFLSLPYNSLFFVQRGTHPLLSFFLVACYFSFSHSCCTRKRPTFHAPLLVALHIIISFFVISFFHDVLETH